jgi:hypothetical protein
MRQAVFIRHGLPEDPTLIRLAELLGGNTDQHRVAAAGLIVQVFSAAASGRPVELSPEDFAALHAAGIVRRVVPDIDPGAMDTIRIERADWTPPDGGVLAGGF